MDDFRKILYGVIIGFIGVILVWVSFITLSGCGYSLSNCNASVPKPDRTPIPSLFPATLPAPARFLVASATPAATAAPAASPSPAAPASQAARPSNPGGPGPAASLKGDPNSGAQIFAANCQVCHGAQGKGGIANPGSTDGTVPPLNPIDPTIADADYMTFATNVDLFVEHGSTPDGTAPTFSMPAWGDKKILMPQQIADVIAYVISLNPPAAPASQAARPSNPGGPGPAASLKGDPNSGAQIFAANCQVCHGTQGKGGVANPGSTDGTVPPLNPIDPTIADANYATFAANVDLFVEHGSTPDGTAPTFSMPAWGDKKILMPQQIADVIAYVISLNPVSGSAAASATATPSSGTATAATAAPTITAPTSAAATSGAPSTGAAASAGVPRPSNPGGPGSAVTLAGDPNAGAQVFAANCTPCHNAEGKGGIANAGSDAGTVPALNPINPALKSPDHVTFVTNLDLFIQHGSTPAGPGPTFSMPPWGDKGALTQQQIADVIAYLISLNP